MGFDLRFYDFENGKLGYFDTIIVDFSTVISRKIAFDLRCCFSKETPADFPNYPNTGRLRLKSVFPWYNIFQEMNTGRNASKVSGNPKTKEAKSKYIGISDDRIHHMLGVARLMSQRAHLFGLDEQEMFALGLLHDIGYEYAREKSEHPAVGSEMMERVGFKYFEAIAGHGDAAYELEDKTLEDALALLNWCDMSVGPDGQRVSMEKRIDDVERRFGRDNLIYDGTVELRDKLLKNPVISCELVRQKALDEFNYVHAPIDLHMHSNCSDGTDTPAQLLERAEKLGLKAFSVCDHDTVEATSELLRLSETSSSVYIPGVELSCFNEYGKYHILGLGYDFRNKELLDVVEELAEKRRAKKQFRIDGLKNEFGIEIPKDVLDEWERRPSVGKPHIAGQLVKMGIAADIQEAIRDYIEPLGSSMNTRIETERAIQGIHAAGGIAIWAHPLGGIGSKGFTKEEFDTRLDSLVRQGIDGMECYYSLYTSEQQDRLVGKARSNGLLISAGSDYHGTNKAVLMGELCRGSRLPSFEDVTVLESLC